MGPVGHKAGNLGMYKRGGGEGSVPYQSGACGGERVGVQIDGVVDTLRIDDAKKGFLGVKGFPGEGFDYRAREQRCTRRACAWCGVRGRGRGWGSDRGSAYYICSWSNVAFGCNATVTMFNIRPGLLVRHRCVAQAGMISWSDITDGVRVCGGG